MIKKRLPIWLALLSMSMLAFTFVQVPLYQTICNVLGIPTLYDDEFIEKHPSMLIDQDRKITILLDLNNTNTIPWKLTFSDKKLTVHPGEMTKVHVTAKNYSDRTITVQAIPSILPVQTSPFLKKTECFCFRQQTLGPGEEIEMPLLFFVDTALPSDYQEMTLSYSFLEIE